MLSSVIAIGFIGLLVGLGSANEVHDGPLLAARQNTPGHGVLRNFMVHEPVLTPAGDHDAYGCVVTQTLMQYSFANSYGKPFVGDYTPPPCSFNRVTINFTVTSRGRQFDRLAIMYLGDYEVWRTSTAEPTPDGIVWTYVKEMQQYNALWKTPQTLIFDLGNLVDETYTAPFNTTLTATFFTVPDSPPTADRILAISKRQGAAGKSSVFQLPEDAAVVADTLPPSVERAVVSVSACGQIGEEFWYTNVYDEDAGTFNASAPLPAGGPWREVQVLVDGHLAGVSWPFPVIFTGGVVPGLWRPIVGIDTFDLREHEIDITPWLGGLLDGKPHTFEIRVAVVGASDGQGGAAVADKPPDYWLVTGKIFLFLHQDGKPTNATPPSYVTTGPDLRVSRQLTQKGQRNNTLTETTSANRSIDIWAVVNGQKVSWTQHLSYTNTNTLAANATLQNTTQEVRGRDASSSGYSSSYTFPLTVQQIYHVSSSGDLVGIDATLAHAQSLTVRGPAVFPSGVQPFNRTTIGSSSAAAVPPPPLLLRFDAPSDNSPQTPLLNLPASLPTFDGAVRSTSLNGTASYTVQKGGASFSFGSTRQTLSFAGTQRANHGQLTELYRRQVEAVNTTITKDHSVLLGAVIRGFDEARPGPVSFMKGEVAMSGGGRVNGALVKQLNSNPSDGGPPGQL